jgi:hypothetical protein
MPPALPKVILTLMQMDRLEVKALEMAYCELPMV